MKKIIMFLVFAFFAFNNINASEVKIINTPYKQTQVLKTVLPEVFSYNNRGWVKQDSVEFVIDFLKSKKITINDPYFKNEYKIKKIKNTKYDVGESYKMKGIDSRKIKYDIEITYYKNNNIIIIIANDSNIVRYRFVI